MSRPTSSGLPYHESWGATPTTALWSQVDFGIRIFYCWISASEAPVPISWTFIKIVSERCGIECHDGGQYFWVSYGLRRQGMFLLQFLAISADKSLLIIWVVVSIRSEEFLILEIIHYICENNKLRPLKIIHEECLVSWQSLNTLRGHLRHDFQFRSLHFVVVVVYTIVPFPAAYNQCSWENLPWPHHR